MQTDKKRRLDLAKIHMAKGALAMDDADYRALIRKVSKGKVHSAADLNQGERWKLLCEFKRLGWQQTAPRKRVASEEPKAAWLLKGLWKTAGEQGVIRKATWQELFVFVAAVNHQVPGVPNESLACYTVHELSMAIDSLNTLLKAAPPAF